MRRRQTTIYSGRQVTLELTQFCYFVIVPQLTNPAQAGGNLEFTDFVVASGQKERGVMNSGRWKKSPRRDPCKLCGSVDFRQLAHRDRKSRELVTVACSQCGLVSHEQIPSDQDLADYYRNQYRHEYHQEYSPSAYRVIREWKRGRELVERMRPFLKGSDRVLEIGSGIGCTVKQFELAGFVSSGIEPGEGFCKFSREQLEASVKQATLEEMTRESQAEVIMLVHVLEHLNQPVEALRHLGDLLTEGGHLYVEVPNFGLPHVAPRKLFHFAHIYNYSAATLTMLGQASGFEVDKRLSDDRDRNLRILFRKSNNVEFQIDKTAYQQSIDAMTRYNTLTYHLRISYLVDRIKTVWSHRRERRGAEEALARIIRLCTSKAAASTISAEAA